MDAYKNFCSFPFTGIYGQQHGLKKYRPCCEWQGEFKQKYSSAEEIWNSAEYRRVRRAFNNRQMPNECIVCVKDEQQGIESMRQWHNKEYRKEADYYYNNQKVVIDSPIYWDMRPSNYCNLECVMCNPENSSAISSRIDTWLKTFKLTDKETSVLNSPIGEINEDSYYEFMKSNVEHVKEILFAGGEPFLMPQVLHLLEWLTENKHSQNIRLRILTNGTVFRSKWMDMLKSFKSLTLLISLDGVEEVVEYARYPNKWSTLEKNVLRFSELNKQPNCSVELNPCVHIMNFVGLHRLFSFAKENNLNIAPTLVWQAQGYKDYLHISRVKPDILEEEIQKCKLVLEGWGKSKDAKSFINSIGTIEFTKGEHNTEFNVFVNYLDSHRPIKFLEQYPYFDYLINN